MNKHLPWLIPALLWLAVIPFTPYLDMTIEGYFYRDGAFPNPPFFAWLYQYGVYPANAVALGAAGVFLFSFFFDKIKSMRRTSLYLVLIMAIGPGLIVNAALKDHWGQPRPRQVIEFGGSQEYRPIWRPNFSPPEPSKAFPCGHCAMGFYFFAPAIAAYRLRRKGVAVFTLIFALCLGGALSIARMEQGGHFFSGIITSALILWLTAYFLAPIIKDKEL